METKYFSQVGQDKFIYETFFPNIKNGIFLDIGAHDGIDKNNTYFFEKFMNWTGICIEPIPKIFENLKINRNCTCINACISDHKSISKFWEIEGYSEMLSGLEDNYNEKHKRRIEDEIIKYGGKITKIDIPVFDINTILNENEIEKVDYCSIDVEGSEEKIISVYDNLQCEISVFTIENNYLSKSLRLLMKSKNYKLHSVIDFDDVYIRNPKKWWFF